MATIWFPFFFKKEKKKKKHKNQKQRKCLIHIWNTEGTNCWHWYGEEEEGKKKKELEGALGLKISTPRSIPTFQKLNSVLLKDMEEEEKASQSPRPQRSKLHLWGCSGVSFKAWQAEPYSRYKHIYILKPFHLFLLWLYNIPWWPDMAAECYTESWRDIKIKKNKKKRKKKVMKLSVEEG